MLFTLGTDFGERPAATTLTKPPARCGSKAPSRPVSPPCRCLPPGLIGEFLRHDMRIELKLLP